MATKTPAKKTRTRKPKTPKAKPDLRQLHPPLVTEACHRALRLMAADQNVSMRALAGQLLASHPDMKPWLKLKVK
jgi:hypothetical protein